MKTTFRKVFMPTIAIMLMAMLLVGGAFQLLSQRYLQKWAEENLRREAEALAKVSTAYFSEDQITSREFYQNLMVCAETAGADAVICDGQGRLVLCSDSPMGCEHTGLAVDRGFYNKVTTDGYYRTSGVVEGLYEEPRLVVAVPIRSSSNIPIGIVMVSAPTTNIRGMFWDMAKIYLAVAVLGMAATMVMAWFFARQMSRSLRSVARAAVSFGQGDLDARVVVEKKAPVEVQEVSRSFNAMAESLQQSETQRREFVSDVSHELKTPMTTISGYVDGILDGTIPDADREKYLLLVSDETKRLSRMVRSMLEMSRVQSHKVFPENQKSRFDACECAGQVLVSFEQKIEEKKIRVGVTLPEDPVYTFAGEDAIIQVLYNLVDNAVKFCPEGGILLFGLTTMDNKILITVENDGPTIPAEELDRLFDRFHKTDKSRSREKEGWGLGLAIARSIMVSHGEEIRVRSVEGKTAFTITLPLSN